MGEHDIELECDDQRLRAFMKALLDDLRALESMLEEGKVESGVRRVGAEQEVFLVDHNLYPAPAALEILDRLADPRWTTEIARFNLEANLTPRLMGGNCFRQMEDELNELISSARVAAHESGADVVLAGILPTLRRSDLSIGNITPNPRYLELNRAIMRLRGGSANIHIKGLDELHITHDNVMMEACNTSFQIHLQVGPEEFAPLYNMAQAVSAPLLAAAVNSPLLLGHRLWQETRLALFQHSVDGRPYAQQVRSQPTRVGFGEGWVHSSILEIFREDIARFRVIMTTNVAEDPAEVLARGEVPALAALRLHNGTVWRWNRPCYGISNGRPHLRIENRVLPSGPTILDEVANAAFFAGLMTALPEEYGPVAEAMEFDDAKANFFAAARHGLKAQFSWLGGRSYSASSLILEHLLPLAREGLKAAGVVSEDVDRYTGTLEERVRSGQTGSQWMLRSLAAMQGSVRGEMRQQALTAVMLARQKSGEPVHGWPIIEMGEPEDWRQSYQTVGQFMSTDLFTVRPDDLVDLAASVMDWRHVRHVPVEDDEGRLVGLVSHRDLLRLLARGAHSKGSEAVAVRDIMKPTPVTATPETPTLEAIDTMRSNRVGCLPIVENNFLVGIVTAQDFLNVSAKIFEQLMRSPEPMWVKVNSSQ